MADTSERLHRIFRRAAIPCLIFLTLLAVFPIAWRISERGRVEEVGSPPPEWLPVLAFTRDDVTLLWYSELPAFEQAHPDYSFLAPEGQEVSLNEKLVASYRKKVPGADAFPKFEVRQISPGRQALKLGLYGDGYTVVWYEATAHEVLPRRYSMIGTMFPLDTLFWSILVTAVFWGFAYGSWRIVRDARLATG